MRFYNRIFSTPEDRKIGTYTLAMHLMTYFKKTLHCFLILLGVSNVIPAFSQTDTTLFTYQELLENILLYHPIAKQANLKLKIGDAQVLKANGLLDPSLNAGWNQKDFNDKLYYRQYSAILNIPTPLGIDFTGGYENTEGLYLNPENSTDFYGLWHLGIEVNLLQGLWINERRIARKQAVVFQNLAENERLIVLNDLLYNATYAYLKWQQYVYFEEVLKENVSIANSYFDNTKSSFLLGEKTALDTLETFILYQDALSMMQKNAISLVKAKQDLQSFLWYKNTPVTLQEDVNPQDYKSQLFAEFNVLEEVNVASNPQILASFNKLNFNEWEQKLKKEKLKPKLKLKYNPLLATSQTGITPTFSSNDYKFGIDFSVPLGMRRERADIQLGEIKIEAANLDLANKTNELQNKINSSWQQQNILKDQASLLINNVENYRRLLEGENEKFRYGESSVFLLNKRQEKYIAGQLKLIEIYVQQQLALLNYLYYSNQLYIG